MEIKRVPIDSIKPYERNAKKHPRKQIEQIKRSIEEFGNNDPIAVDANGVIIEGHGRYMALEELGYTEVDIIQLGHLTEEQAKAYLLVHNQLTMNTGWDKDMVNMELMAIEEIDMAPYGLELPDLALGEEEEEQEEVFETDRKYLLHLVDHSRLEPAYEMPMLAPTDFIPSELMPFNYVLSDKGRSEDKGIHFYIDDYQFERIWQRPEDYIKRLTAYSCALTPDFSLYLDMPLPIKIWNVYRSRLIGQIMQRYGIEVIPTLSWGDADTFDFAFEGLPVNSVVSVSTVGVLNDSESLAIWKAGMDEAIRRLKPSAVVVYGNDIDYDFGDTKAVYFKSNTQERFRSMKETV